MQHAEPVYMTGSTSLAAEKTHTTSGVGHCYLAACYMVTDNSQRRRAQNRAAQRAFRERKEKHARDLEVQLSAMSEKYNRLELSHTELNAAYEKLRKTIELLTQDDDAEGEDEDGRSIKRKSSSSDTLRKLLDILHGEIKGVTPVKSELA
jgi:AP-1-like factor